MPTYQYACTVCGHHLEAVQSFTDQPLTECPSCAGRLRKLFSAVGIVFKGSGFYRTDSRAGSTVSGARAEKPATAGTAPTAAPGATGSGAAPASGGSAKSSTGEGSTGNGSAKRRETPAAAAASAG